MVICDINRTFMYHVINPYVDHVVTIGSLENTVPRNVIIYRGAAEVDNHISRDDVF